MVQMCQEGDTKIVDIEPVELAAILSRGGDCSSDDTRAKVNYISAAIDDNCCRWPRAFWRWNGRAGTEHHHVGIGGN